MSGRKCYELVSRGRRVEWFTIISGVRAEVIFFSLSFAHKASITHHGREIKWEKREEKKREGVNTKEREREREGIGRERERSKE